MEKIIYFLESEDKHGVIRFVKSYKPKRWFRGERIEYTPFSLESMDCEDDGIIVLSTKRVMKDFPQAKVFCDDYATFLKKFETKEFWVICHYDEEGAVDGYYSRQMSVTTDGRPWLTEDIKDAEISLDYKEAKMTRDNLRRTCNERFSVCPIYLDLTNLLLTPIMMITCTSKRGKQETKYFSKMDGNRLRLVTTSNAAAKFTYAESLDMFELLKSSNKNFLYAVIPAFSQNVHAKNIGTYMREKNISRMVQMTMNLNKLNVRKDEHAND